MVAEVGDIEDSKEEEKKKILMASEPVSNEPHTEKIAARSSLYDSIKGCGIGVRTRKQELATKIVIPQYLRRAMLDAVERKNPDVGDRFPRDEFSKAPQTPIVVFVNSRSGGRHGPMLKRRLQDLIGEEQVFDLSVVMPPEFVQYGLACLEKLASLGDHCAKETRERMRVMVAGGDGTAGWVLGSLAELCRENREPVPPVGIIPLGTGNDMSRSFGWGGSFPFLWRAAMKRSLHKAIHGPICRLDSWHVSVTMPVGDNVALPHCLRHTGLTVGAEIPKKQTCFEGSFYNYYSIGMDAQVAYGFHRLRNEKPYLAQGPITNKLIYSGYSLTQGWFCTPCTSVPSLRGLRNILKVHILKVNSTEWEQLQIPSGVRSIVALNLNNYGSGRNPWGKLKPKYMEKRGFVPAHADDGVLEIFGLKQGWHASFVMVELISAIHIAQAAAIKLEFRGGASKRAYMQMDGEPWKQPINNEYSTFVEIKRTQFQSLMIRG